MELRRVIPNRVTKPTIDPSEMRPPVKATAKTPPTKANGRLIRTSIRFCQCPVTIDSRTMMPILVSDALTRRSRRDCACASAVPANSTCAPGGSATSRAIFDFASATNDATSRPLTFAVTVWTRWAA